MTIHSLSFTGANSVIPLSVTPLAAKWVQWYADSANGSNTILMGDGEVTSSVGFPLIAGAYQFTPPISEANVVYDLSQQMAYVPIGATLHILYGI